MDVAAESLSERTSSTLTMLGCDRKTGTSLTLISVLSAGGWLS